MFYVYVLKRGKSLYIGSTNDLLRRFKEHAKVYPCKLCYYEAYTTKSLASQRELQLKQYGGSWRSLKRRLGL